MSALNDIQKAIFTKLTADSTLSTLITGVFDYVPDNTPFPQVIIGEFIETAWNTFNRKGKNVVLHLHVMSDKPGNKEAFTIISRLNAILDNATLTLENHALVSVQFEDTTMWNALPSDSNVKELREVMVKYRIYVQEL